MTEQPETAARASQTPGDSPPKHAQQPPRHAAADEAPVATSSASGWTGVVVFAGIMFIILGAAEAAMAITTALSPASTTSTSSGSC